MTSNSPTRANEPGGDDRVNKAGRAFRALFILALAAATVWVSLPANLDGSTLHHFTTGEFVKATIGLGVSVGLAFALFTYPKDPEANRTWAYLGCSLIGLLLVYLCVPR